MNIEKEKELIRAAIEKAKEIYSTGAKKGEFEKWLIIFEKFLKTATKEQLEQLDLAYKVHKEDCEKKIH